MKSIINILNSYVNVQQEADYWLLLVAIISFSFGMYVLINNLILRKNYDEKIRILGYRDEVTGFNNYAGFTIRAKEILKDNDGYKYAMMIIDIRDYQMILMKYGYNAIKAILEKIAKDIDFLLKSDDDFARMHDDVFVVLKRYRDAEELISLFKQISLAINDYANVNGIGDGIILNGGIYQITSHHEDLSMIVKKANMANRLCRKNDSKNIEFYNNVLERNAYRENEILMMMERGIEKQEFELYFQPKFNMVENKIVGAEALVRWRNAKVGFVTPDVFLPLFEKNGFICKLDLYVFESVCRQIRTWLDQGMVVLPISINFSMMHFKDPKFVDELKRIVLMYRIPFKYIELEFAESAYFSSRNSAIEVIKKLKITGFKVLLDDFGQNYSSLQMISSLPIDCVKLDKNYFINDSKERSGLVLKNFINMANDLKFDIICEGVETMEQATLLRKAGFKYAQGYYFAKPLPLKNYENELVFGRK